MRLSLPSLGVRSRVAAGFALGALLLSVVLAGGTYAIASSYLTEQRYQTVLRQSLFHADAVRAALNTTRPAIPDLLGQLDVTSGNKTSSLVWNGRRWYDEQLEGGHRQLPVAFREAVVRGDLPVRQRFVTVNGLALAVALPIEGADAVYIQIAPLEELDQVLTTLAVTFVGTASVTTALGLLLGLWASRRALRPLTEVTRAAGEIAAGDLNARLHAPGDPDLRGLAEAFNRTATRLQARVARDARFASSVSHELRSPLTTLVNAADLLSSRRDRLDPEGGEVLDLLVEEAHRFAGMEKDLLEISLADAGAASLQCEPTDLPALVRLAADRRVGRPVTTVDASAEGLLADVDRRRVERAVVNLVENAEVHGGGVTAVRLSASGDVARIAVEDDGPGVPEGEQHRIFERFQRAVSDRSGNPGGVGLGLALVAEHVRLHGGQVWAENREPRGARFVLDLPIHR